MTNDIQPIFNELVEKIYNHNPPKIDWQDSIYESIMALSIDQRGQVGEELVAKILTDSGCVISYKPNATDREKDWDIISNGMKIEVKLATLGKDGKMFQHENLERQRRFDALMILDVAPDTLYLSCFDYNDLDWNAMHRRPSGIWKFDIPRKKLIEGNNKIETLAAFIESYKTMEIKTLARLGKKKGDAQL